MKDAEVENLRNNILFDLDTIRIEQTCISDPKGSYKLLKLLKEIQDNVEERFDSVK